MGFTFLYPSMLWGLLFVLIPIILHLFNFRRFKTIYFSNVDLLKEIKEESKKSRTLKKWLILLFRILFITFLVLAFAFPISGEENIEEDKTIGIYIDNSFSMDTDGIEGNKLDNAKAYADQIISSLPPNTKIHLTTNDFKGDHQIALNKIKAQDEISKILPTNKSRDISNIYDRQQLFFNRNTNTNLYWISDFQQLEDTLFKNLQDFKIQLGLLKSIDEGNISIDSVWFESPVRKKMGNEFLNFKITNQNKSSIKDFNINLKINDRVKILNINNLTTGESNHKIEYQVPTDSIIEGEIFLEDGVSAFDNKISFSYLIPQQQKVCLISDAGSGSRKIVKRIFASDSLIELTYFTPLNLDFGKLANNDFIILGELNLIPQTLINELKKLADLGKTITIIPGEKIDLESYEKASLFWGNTKYNEIDTSSVTSGSISKKHPFFSGVFEEQKIKENLKESFPNINKSYPLSGSRTSNVLIYKENGSPYLISENGFYLFSSGITSNHSNLAKKAIIVPLFYQMLFNSVSTTPIQYFIKPTMEIEVPATDLKTLDLTKEQFKSQLRIINKKAQLPNNIKTGNYVLKSNSKTLGAFSINTNRTESKKIEQQLVLLDELESKEAFSQIEISGNKNSNLSKIADKPGSLWLTCLIIAISFLSLEMIFIRIKVG